MRRAHGNTPDIEIVRIGDEVTLKFQHSPSSGMMSRSVLEGRTKVVMSRKGKAQIGKGLGFNLCVAPRPTLSPYFGSGRLRSERRSTKTEAENFRGT